MTKPGTKRSEESIRKQKAFYTPEKRLELRNRRLGSKASEETKQRQSKSQKQRWTPERRLRQSSLRKGMKFTEEHIINLTKANRLKAKDPTICKKISENTKGKRRSDEMKQSIRGENNHEWKGGITTLYKSIRECSNYYQWREAVYKRDNYCDWFSGVKGNGNLNAHHIYSFNKLLSEYNIKTIEQAMVCEALWDINNGVTMLETSHAAYHSMWGKE
jgi:hypothetical protein